MSLPLHQLLTKQHVHMNNWDRLPITTDSLSADIILPDKLYITSRGVSDYNSNLVNLRVIHVLAKVIYSVRYVLHSLIVLAKSC